MYFFFCFCCFGVVGWVCVYSVSVDVRIASASYVDQTKPKRSTSIHVYVKRKYTKTTRYLIGGEPDLIHVDRGQVPILPPPLCFWFGGRCGHVDFALGYLPESMTRTNPFRFFFKLKESLRESARATEG